MVAPRDFAMECVFADIGRYAKEHNLTPDQVRIFFEPGAAAACNLGVVDLTPKKDPATGYAGEAALGAENV